MGHLSFRGSAFWDSTGTATQGQLLTEASSPALPEVRAPILVKSLSSGRRNDVLYCLGFYLESGTAVLSLCTSAPLTSNDQVSNDPSAGGTGGGSGGAGEGVASKGTRAKMALLLTNCVDLAVPPGGEVYSQGADSPFRSSPSLNRAIRTRHRS